MIVDLQNGSKYDSNYNVYVPFYVFALALHVKKGKLYLFCESTTPVLNMHYTPYFSSIILNT